MNNPPLKYCLGLPVLTALFSVCFLTVSGFATLPPLQTVRWETDLNAATARAEREQRPLFFHFFGNDSSSAQQMGNEVFTQPNIAAHVNANFVMVRVNAIENPALAQQLSVTAVPTDLIMRPNGQIIHRRVGVIPADKFVEFLAFLQDRIQQDRNQQDRNQIPTQASATPPLVASPFPGSPQGGSTQGTFQPHASFQSVPPPAAMPPSVAPPSAMPPGTAHTLFALQSPPIQHPVAHYPSAQHQTMQQHPSVVMGATVAPAPPTHNPLRATDTRPAWEQQSTGTTGIDTTRIGTTGTPNTPPVPPIAAPPVVATTIQAMLAEPAPAKMTIEVPLALEGFCPVVLYTEERWVPGNPAYSTMFQGHVFRFSSLEALITFAQSPANYIPVAMGEDIVLKVDRNRRVSGDRRFGAWFQGRVFLFSSQETFSTFELRPDFYAEIALKYETARRGHPLPIVH